MKDADIRGLVLQKLFDARNARRRGLKIPEGLDIPGFDLSEEHNLHVLGNATKQLAEKNLITFHEMINRPYPSGLAIINADGIDVVEGTARSPISITLDNSVNVHGSQGVQVGGQGNVQNVTLDVGKLINAIDGGSGTIQEKEEAKSLLKRVIDNPLVKGALEWWAKSHTGG